MIVLNPIITEITKYQVYSLMPNKRCVLLKAQKMAISNNLNEKKYEKEIH